MNIIYEGWLLKLSHKRKNWNIFKQRWSKKYFLLCSHSGLCPAILCYFDHQPHTNIEYSKQQNIIDLYNCSMICPLDGEQEQENVFTISTKYNGKEILYYLSAESFDERSKWISFLCSILQISSGINQFKRYAHENIYETNSSKTLKTFSNSSTNEYVNDDQDSYVNLTECYSGFSHEDRSMITYIEQSDDKITENTTQINPFVPESLNNISESKSLNCFNKYSNYSKTVHSSSDNLKIDNFTQPFFHNQSLEKLPQKCIKVASSEILLPIKKPRINSISSSSAENSEVDSVYADDNEPPLPVKNGIYASSQFYKNKMTSELKYYPMNLEAPVNYLDLDFDKSDISKPNKKSKDEIKLITYYEIDWLKTQALTDTRNNVECKRQCSDKSLEMLT